MIPKWTTSYFAIIFTLPAIPSDEFLQDTVDKFHRKGNIFAALNLKSSRTVLEEHDIRFLTEIKDENFVEKIQEVNKKRKL